MIVQAPKTYGSESGHWYYPDGTPCHEVAYSDPSKGLRPTTLRDAKKMGLYPSVSGILGIMAKPGLNGWMKEQVALVAVETNQFEWNENTHPDEAVPIILAKAEERMTRARDLGTKIHGAIDRFLRCCATSIPPDFDYVYQEHIKAAMDALKEMGVWGQPFQAERTFASPLGYGGTIDFRANWIFADFKCVDSLEKKLDYPDRCSQLCAYAIGAFGFTELEYDWSLFRLANIFISTSDPGKYLIHEWSQEDKDHGWKLFLACQELWQISNRYDPCMSNKP